MEIFQTIVGGLLGGYVAKLFFETIQMMIPTRRQRQLRIATKQMNRLNEIMEKEKGGGSLEKYATELWEIYMKAEIEFVSILAFVLAKKSSQKNSVLEEVEKILCPIIHKKND